MTMKIEIVGWILILLLGSLSAAYWLPNEDLGNTTRHTLFSTTSIETYPGYEYNMNEIIRQSNHYIAFQNCNQTFRVVFADNSWTNILYGNTSKWIQKDDKYWYMGNGIYLKYDYTFKNRSVFDIGYLYKSEWMYEDKYNCPYQNISTNIERVKFPIIWIWINAENIGVYIPEHKHTQDDVLTGLPKWVRDVYMRVYTAFKGK